MVGGREAPSSSPSQSLVFTNSHHHQTPQQHQQPPSSRNSASGTSYAHAALVTYLIRQTHSFTQDMRTETDDCTIFLSVPVISSRRWFWGLGPSQKDSTQCWSSDTRAAKGSWLGPATFISGGSSCQHPRKQQHHWPTAKPRSACTSTLVIQLGPQGLRIKHHLAVLTVQP